MTHNSHIPLILTRLFHKRALITLSCLILLSCSKKSGAPAALDTDKDPAVYVAGDDGANPILWKNGDATTLSITGGSASQVLLSGSDLYVAGSVDQNFNNVVIPIGPSGQPCYWKNGAQTNIGNPAFFHGKVCCSIAVAGNNVYFSTTSLWENGHTVPPAPTGFTNISWRSSPLAQTFFARDSTASQTSLIGRMGHSTSLHHVPREYFVCMYQEVMYTSAG